MEQILCIILCMISFISLAQSDHSQEVLRKYLIEQKQYVHKGVERKHGTIESFEIPNRVDYNTVGSESVTNYTDIFAFRVNSTNHLIIGNKLHTVSMEKPTLGLKYDSSFPSGRIKLCKTIDYLNFTSVALTYESGITYIYWFKHYGAGFTFLQSIYSENPSDSLFFVNDDKLYLVIVKELGKDISIFLTYTWTGTHFDQSHRITTRRTTSVASFRWRESEIIILVQNFKNASYAMVLEFKSQSIRKLQHLPIAQPATILPYKFQNDYYIVNLGLKEHVLYWWSGSELLEWSVFNTDQKSYGGIHLIAGNASVILSVEHKMLITYSITRDGISVLNRKIHDMNLEEISKISTFLLGDHFIIAVIEQNHIKFEVINFILHTTMETVGELQKRHGLLGCLLQLENRTNILRHEYLESKRTIRDTSLFTDIDDSSDLVLTVKNELEVLNVKINRVEEIKEQYNNVGDRLIIFGDGNLVKGDVNANSLHGKIISMRNLQNQRWVPDQWLRNNRPQSITAPVKVKTIKTKYLEANLKIFEDLMLNDGNTVITQDVHLNKLSVQSLHVKQLNDIFVHDLYVKNKDDLVEGRKVFENLTTDKAFVDLVNGGKYEEHASPFFSIFNENLHINNLHVKNIDTIDFESVRNTAFRIGHHHEIKGNLILKKMVTENLRTNSLNNTSVDSFLNTRTNQTIEGLFESKQIFGGNVTVDKVNGIILEKEAVIFGDKIANVLEGPIHMMNTVTNNLIIRGPVGDDVWGNMSDLDKKSLLQIYHGKVKIKGTVHIANLKIPKDVVILLPGHNVTNNTLNEYWTKSTSQIISVLFEASEGMIVPDLRLTKLNNIPITEYMINDDRPKEPTRYYFENVKVLGHVYLKNNEKHLPDLLAINKASVKLNGTYEITGKKTYVNPLKVHNLNILKESEFVESYIGATSSVTHSDLKNLTKLIVMGDFKCDNLMVNSLNNVSLEDLKKKSLYVDVDHKFEELHFANTTVETLTVLHWNGRNVSEFKMTGLKPFLIEVVIVNGDVIMSEVVNLRNINGHATSKLLKQELDIMTGQLKIPRLVFQNKTTITDILAAKINDIYFPSLTERLLYNNIDQVINGNLTCRRIEADNIIVDYINDLSTDSMIDVSKAENQIMNVTKGLVFRSHVTIKSFFVNGHVDKTSLGYLQEHVWPLLVVDGNVTFMDEMSIFKDLFINAVTSEDSVNIFPEVTLADVEANNVHTEHFVNHVNVSFLVQDALYRYSKEEQVISGHVIFEDLITSDTFVHANLDTYTVDNVVIYELDKAIIKNNSQIGVIGGQKTFFFGLQCKYFNASSIQGEVNQIVDKFHLKLIPETVFDAVAVGEDLHVKQINDKNLNFLLANRMLLHGAEQVIDAAFVLNSLKVKGNIYTESINDVTIDSVVFDYDSPKIQSHKTFLNDIIVNGSMRVEYINGDLLSEQYKRAIIKNENAVIKGNIVVSKPSQLTGGIRTEQINGVRLTDLMSNLERGKKYMGPKTQVMIDKMEDVVKKSTVMMMAMKNEYMYIERAQDIQLSIPNALHAEVVSVRHYELIHVTKEEPGVYCDLPARCTCKVQETVQITPQNSVVSFSNKDYRRVYSYDDDEATYHFITNSTSYSDVCREDDRFATSESSMLTWSTKSTRDTPSTFYMYPYSFQGYISIVRYFTIEGYTYMVIGRYYDAVHNSYDLDCIVLQFSATKDKANEIQRIPTRGVRTLTLFHTANGLILVIGNAVYSNEDDYTQIFKFDVSANKFKILRVVPGFGCNAAEGVVFGTESMIMLAHEKAPLQILKYEEAFDNYYFYQSLDLESKVISISVFYIKDFGISDAFLCVVTGDNRYFIYSYRFVEGWIQISTGEYDGLKSLSVLTLNKNQHLLVGTTEMSWLLKIVKYGSD